MGANRYDRPRIDYSRRVVKYRAVCKDGAAITSVLADGPENARALIRYELDKNPSRRWYLERWQEDGEIVEVEPPCATVLFPRSALDPYPVTVREGRQIDTFTCRDAELLDMVRRFCENSARPVFTSPYAVIYFLDLDKAALVRRVLGAQEALEAARERLRDASPEGASCEL